MKKKMVLILVIILSQLMFFHVANGEASISFRQPFPKDISVFVTNPEISMKLILNENEIENIDMKLNDNSVLAKYDKERELIFYKPIVPLKEGKHTVFIEVEFKDWESKLKQSWSFNIQKEAIKLDLLTTDSQRTMLKVYNDFRQTMGLKNVVINSSLNAAAKAHTSYMIRNNDLSHDEFNGKAGFKGATYTVRARAYGYNGINIYEAIHKSLLGDADIFEEVFNDPYNKIILMNPFAQDFGYFKQDSYMTLLTGNIQNENNKLVVWPRNNQWDINRKWEVATQNNMPFISHDAYIGEPIIISYYTEHKLDTIQLNSFTLKNENGELIDTYINEPKNDDKLSNSIIVTPVNPLQSNHIYNMNFEITAKYYDKEAQMIPGTSQFRTKPLEKTALEDIKGHWAEETMGKLYGEKIIELIDGEYLPEEMIKRGDFAKYIVKMLDIPLKSVTGEFKDLNRNEEMTKYIEAAKNEGIINGYPDGNFLPNNKITRAEIAVMINRVYKQQVNKPVVIDNYTTELLDEDQIQPWALEAIKVAHKLNIIKGKTDGRYYPFANTTRAEASVILDRINNIIKEQE